MANASTPPCPTRLKPKRPTIRELAHDASAIGAATAANTSPIAPGAWNASKTICWTEEM